MQKSTVIKGLILVLVAIILGALGAHYLKTKLSTEELNSFEVGVKYQIYGGLLILTLANNKLLSSYKKLINLFFIGNIIFSSSIYYLSLTKETILDKFFGPITPLGGMLMIISLLIIIYKVIGLKE